MKSKRVVARIAGTFVLIGMALGMILPATVAAASLPTLHVTLGRDCTDYSPWTAESTFKLVWRNADGDLVGKKTITTDQYGEWEFCAPGGHVFTAGDQLKVTVDADSKTLAIPGLTLNVNRVHDYLSGRAPAGSGLRVHCAGANGFEPCQWQDGVRTGDHGYWSHAVPWSDGIPAGYPFYLTWRSPAGDTVEVDANAPILRANVGTAKVSGYYDANATTYVRLYDSTMTLKGTALITGAAYAGGFQGTFRDSGGNPVAAEPTDTIKSGIASDSQMVVPQIDATATASTDRVTGQCEQTASASNTSLIEDFRTRNRVGWTNRDGTFNFNFRRVGRFENPANVKPGDRVVVTCGQTAGDEASDTFYAQ